MTAKIFELRPKEECQIESFFHCKKCMDQLPDNESPMNYQNIQAGWTEQGLQVWCVRHDLKIIHIDFEGQMHAAI